MKREANKHTMSIADSRIGFTREVLGSLGKRIKTGGCGGKGEINQEARDTTHEKCVLFVLYNEAAENM
jgi:hypothetical protein